MVKLMYADTSLEVKVTLHVHRKLVGSLTLIWRFKWKAPMFGIDTSLSSYGFSSKNYQLMSYREVVEFKGRRV